MRELETVSHGAAHRALSGTTRAVDGHDQFSHGSRVPI